ncbi:Telomere length regulation/capping, TEN1 [Trichophyton interdigitale]|uniref:Telomere length regulation/capping, TEN1 n=1 Tax=Trichophyton interdigitale TaxID=101480 RepID=A0A9P4YG48_9EURO|nr:Telomere length regulation/capping, TEN1 [Trichophyton interdigitale]KAF3893927.1 Telomere length regulation/capping, TEN1 [Trichophyton interdigitale]KAG8208977.1 Telomere length regulation/capping, TEN1 [Trichophyton interdigitale]
MDQAVPGPAPTKLVFLSQIPTYPVNFKVRFLGCVSKYNTATGRLTLHHNYSVHGLESQISHVEVDINLLLEDTDHTSLQIGVWLNVFGYIREENSDEYRRREGEGTRRNSEKEGHISSDKPIYVQAVTILPAGPVRIGEYERILRDMQRVERRVNDDRIV